MTSGSTPTLSRSSRHRIHVSFKFVQVKQVKSSQCHITTDGQSVSKSWCRALIWGSWPDIFYCLIFAVLFLSGALSDERTGLSFVYAAGPCQRSLSRVRVPWNSRPYFTVSDSRLPFSSPPTTRRVTVEKLEMWLNINGIADSWVHKSWIIIVVMNKIGKLLRIINFISWEKVVK
jgi:hypothetical protein